MEVVNYGIGSEYLFNRIPAHETFVSDGLPDHLVMSFDDAIVVLDDNGLPTLFDDRDEFGIWLSEECELNTEALVFRSVEIKQVVYEIV